MATSNTIDENLNSIDSASKQIVEIFEFARDYERLRAERLVYLNVQKLFGEAISLFPDMNGAKAAANCEGLRVLGDSLLRQVFYNLIDDSRKYGKKLTQIKLTFRKNTDESIDLVYEDDGVGISTEARPKLFHEGFTTGNGTGYGLYLVKRIIEAYGWTIEETGEFEKGARFRINIPKKGRNLDENYRLATEK
jgi:signal transduction histidine kinase